MVVVVPTTERRQRRRRRLSAPSAALPLLVLLPLLRQAGAFSGSSFPLPRGLLQFGRGKAAGEVARLAMSDGPSEGGGYGGVPIPPNYQVRTRIALTALPATLAMPCLACTRVVCGGKGSPC